jgi:phosphatidylinositol dimannoside acyltransferase
MNHPGRWRTGIIWLQDWIECRLAPAFAGLLPWPVFFRFSRLICARLWLFGAPTRESLAAATAFGQVRDPALWRQGHALVRLIDQVDASISARRGDAWMDRYLDVDGCWPTGPFVGITFHFGAGLWAIRHLRRAGQRSSFLSARLHPDAFPGHPQRYQFELRRMAEVERVAAAKVIYVGRSLDKMRAALSDGVSVIGLVDVVPRYVPATRTTTFLARQARFPDGLLHLARSGDVPLAVFICYPDVQTGRRHLAIREVDARRDDALDSVVSVLETAMAKAPWAWHLWPIAHEFLDGCGDGADTKSGY